MGNCFEVNGMHFKRKAVPGWYLCHGIVINSIDHKPMSHCWIEYEVEFKCEIPETGRSLDWSTDYVIDKSNDNDFRAPRFLYYEAGKIDPKDVVRYDLGQFIDMLLQEESYGPWEIKCDR